MMTVKQLIEKLSTLPSDAFLVTDDEDSGDYVDIKFRVYRASSEEEAFVTTDCRGHECVVVVSVK